MKWAGIFSSFALALLTLNCVGCGGERSVPVEGVVTLDGKPLAGATVSLQRATGPIKERVFSADTDTSGRYQIMSRDRTAAGAPPGEYHVTITSVKMPPNTNELTKLPAERVPLHWRNGSEISTVPEGGTTAANFAMTTR